MAGIVTAIVVFLVILTFSAYRSKNKAYQQLEYQTIQIHEQKEELKELFQTKHLKHHTSQDTGKNHEKVCRTSSCRTQTRYYNS